MKKIIRKSKIRTEYICKIEQRNAKSALAEALQVEPYRLVKDENCQRKPASAQMQARIGNLSFADEGIAKRLNFLLRHREQQR